MKNKNVPTGFGWSQGEVARQPHVKIPNGSYEEEFGRRGFFGKATHLYHRHPPTGWLRIEGPLKPRAYYASKLPGGNSGTGQFFLENEDCRIGIYSLEKENFVFLRNADADEVHFIHDGTGLVETDFGDFSYEKGDYIVIPRGTTYRFTPKKSSKVLLIEALGSEVELPDRGMLGPHALFDPMVMDVPELPKEEKVSGKNTQGEYELWVKREGEHTKVFYPYCPINSMGWKGNLSCWKLNIRDIRPVVSPRYHLPPSVHTSFIARNFVICSFLPRPLEEEEGAMKVPFYHRNIDFDEVIFYHEGNFFSREGISEGSVTFHPQGIHHGPHPNAEKNASDKKVTEEKAVMIDTARPLRPTALAESVEYKEYYMSWRADQKR